MRMIFTHGISNDTGTFTVRAVVADTKLIHIVKGTALYWLQSVTYIRQCSGNDNTHGVVYIRFLHDLRIVGADNILLFRIHISILPILLRYC